MSWGFPLAQHFSLSRRVFSLGKTRCHLVSTYWKTIWWGINDTDLLSKSTWGLSTVYEQAWKSIFFHLDLEMTSALAATYISASWETWALGTQLHYLDPYPTETMRNYNRNYNKTWNKTETLIKIGISNDYALVQFITEQGTMNTVCISLPKYTYQLGKHI